MKKLILEEKLLRRLIREIKATVDISADPSLAKYFDGGEDGLEFSLHLDPQEIQQLVTNAEEQTGKRIDRLQTSLSGTGAGALSAFVLQDGKTLKQAFEDVGARFGKKFADQALIKVQESLKDGDLTSSMIFNPSQVTPLASIPIEGSVRDLARLKPSYGERGKEKGKGEMLASIMFGFEANIDEPDITIPGKGGWHIKSFGSEDSARTTVQSGEGGAVARATDCFVKKYGNYGLTKSKRFGKRKISEIEQQISAGEGNEKAQEFRDDFNALATISVTEPGGTAKGMLRLNRESEFFFIPANKVGAAGLNNGRLDIARDPLSAPTPDTAIARMRDCDVAAQSPSTSSVAEQKKIRSVRLLIKETLLNEELTRADKKEIDRMIAKRIEKDRVEQKRLFKKQLEEEIKSTKFQKMILEMAQESMGKELKGKQLQAAVVDVTKKVIKKLYRELSYSYNPVIDRIKL